MTKHALDLPIHYTDCEYCCEVHAYLVQYQQEVIMMGVELYRSVRRQKVRHLEEVRLGWFAILSKTTMFSET